MTFPGSKEGYRYEQNLLYIAVVYLGIGCLDVHGKRRLWTGKSVYGKRDGNVCPELPAELRQGCADGKKISANTASGASGRPSRTTLGEPLAIRSIELKDLKAYRPGAGLKSMPADSRTTWYPVLVNNAVQAKLEIVESAGKLLSGGFGAASEARRVSAARQQIPDQLRAKGIQVRMLVRSPENVAEQVKAKKSSLKLEPMSPFERRIIHLSLANDPEVITESTGEGESRKVVVLLKNNK